MLITGITAEFNPLHKGHAYMMRKARALTGCDAVVVAMSGDFVQRGEPAIADKWTRAGWALSYGADLVIEIPVLFCLGNAGQFASAGVRLLEAAGCDHIAFGSESADIDMIRSRADALERYSDEIQDRVSILAKDGFSYPAARSRALREIAGIDGCSDPGAETGPGPNDVLAIEYVRSMKHAEPVAIKRIGAGYNDTSFDVSGPAGHDDMYQSAAGIREMIRQNVSIFDHVPDDVFGSLFYEHTASCDDFWDMLRYSVLSGDAGMIEDCPSGGEGLGNLLRKEIFRAESFEGFIRSVKSKRYTYSRISRLCMQVLLGITRSGYPFDQPGYIRVLGSNDMGRKVLSGLRGCESPDLPVITNINKNSSAVSGNAASMLALDVHAADIYNLMTHRDLTANSDHIKKIIVV